MMEVAMLLGIAIGASKTGSGIVISWDGHLNYRDTFMDN